MRISGNQSRKRLMFLPHFRTAGRNAGSRPGRGIAAPRRIGGAAVKLQIWPRVRIFALGWISFCDITGVSGRKRSTMDRT